MTETTELALFPKLNLPSVTGVTEQMNKSFGTMYTRIEQGIAELPTDMSIKANREAVASYAYSISRTKTGLDKAAADVSGDAKQIVDAVNSERRTLKETLDSLRDKARAPLDAWEAAEKERQDRVAAERQKLSSAPASSALMSAEELRETINYLDKPYSGEEYGEDASSLIALREETLSKLRDMIDTKEREERERAELEQLRREKAEREAAEQARIAEEQRKIDEENERIRQQEEADRMCAADIAHRKKINSAAVAALIKTAGITEPEAQAVVTAIYKQQVPSITINY